MRSIVRPVLCLLVLGCLAFAQPDLTVQWKTALRDLEQRLASLPADGSAASAAWRADEEALRTSVAAYAAANPDLKLQVPDALPDSPSKQAASQQFDQLTTAVNLVIGQTPGTPFNLGHVE